MQTGTDLFSDVQKGTTAKGDGLIFCGLRLQKGTDLFSAVKDRRLRTSFLAAENKSVPFWR